MKHSFVLLMFLMLMGTSVYAQLDEAREALRNDEYDRALSMVDEILERNANDVKALELEGRVFEEKVLAMMYNLVT